MVRASLMILSSVALTIFVGAASCRPRAVDASSEFALKAGQATVVIGSSCQKGLAIGYASCQFERGSKVPTMEIAFLNPGEYVVSDCEFGILKSGSVQGPSTVSIDLAPLSEFLKKNFFCLLKVDAIERYPDRNDPSQTREIPMAGGFFLEMLEPGFMPIPDTSVIGWSCTVERTTKGRTKVSCK